MGIGKKTKVSEESNVDDASIEIMRAIQSLDYDLGNEFYGFKKYFYWGVSTNFYKQLLVSFFVFIMFFLCYNTFFFFFAIINLML